MTCIVCGIEAEYLCSIGSMGICICEEHVVSVHYEKMAVANLA